MIFQHHRFQIHNQSQHPYSHTLTEFSYSNPALPEGEVVNAGEAIDWLFAVLYPQSMPAVDTFGDLPAAGNTLNDYRVVRDDGDGKSAGYRWEQREGEVAPSWHKIYDMDWGEESVLSGFIDKTLDVYVKRAGYDDLDGNGNPYAGDLAGQRIYGGASPNTHLILYANSGDGVGANTGFIQPGDNVRPLLDSQLSLGTDTYRWNEVFTDSITSGTTTIAAGEITDTTGFIDFDDENLLTEGTITAGATLVLDSGSITDSTGAINFADEHLITTGNISATIFAGTTGNITTVNAGTVDADLVYADALHLLGFGAGLVKLDAFDISYSDLLLDADVANNAAITLSKLAALTIDRALISNGSGVIAPSAVTATELGYVSGVTSSIQTQLDTKANRALSNLTATAINQALIPNSSDSLNLGTGALRWSNIYAAGISNGTTGLMSMDHLMTFRDSVTGAVTGDALFYDAVTGRWLPSAPDSEIDHGTLNGIGDDDHTQYALLAGRAGGQILIGGAGVGDNLTLSTEATGGIVAQNSVIPSADNAKDLGSSAAYWKDLYLKGQAKGLRIENVAALPAASALTVGRVAYNTTNKDVFVDEGGLWRRVGVERFISDSVWDGIVLTKTFVVSAVMDEAREAIWQFKDTAANSYEVMYPDITMTQTAVTVTFAVAPLAGTYKIVGIR